MSRLFLTLWIAIGACGIAVGQETEPLGEAVRLLREGEYRRAEERLRSAGERGPLSLRLEIELLDRRGALEEAHNRASRSLGLYQSGAVRTAEELAQVAYAAWYLQRWEDANDLYIEAADAGGSSPSMYVDWGNLYLEKYNPSEAEKIFQEGVRAAGSNSGLERWDASDLYLGLARALQDQGRPGSEQALEKAAEINPENLRITAFRASQAIKEDDWDQAEELIEEGLDQDEGNLPLLELKAARVFFMGEEDAYGKARAAVLEINPSNDHLFELLGDLAVMKRRMEEAIEFYEKSLEIRPTNWSALASKGINLLRLGREDEGISALERAYENDPYNIWTVNTLRLVDSFERFVRVEKDDFSIKLHQEEASALEPYVVELLERSLSELERRYNHQIGHKVTFEMYPDHEDFAVRTLGLPGLGALGATFGRVVAMDSPSAREKDEFHWASTLWHEMAHVVTLSLSDSKVPRWFTEGLSMMEERLGGPGWGDSLSLSFIDAYQDDRLLPLSELNAGFIRPKFPEQVALSYLQAGWVCEVLARDFGLPRLREMLVAYGAGKTTEEVFQEVLQQSVEEVDERLRAEMARVLDPLKEKLKRPDGPLKTIEEIAAALSSDPENFHLNLALGRAMAEEGRDAEAIPFLEKARAIFPEFAGKSSPYAFLARIYAKQKRTEKEIEILEEWWRRHPLIAGNALRLSRLLAEQGESGQAIQVLRGAIYTDPLSSEIHQKLGELYLAERQLDEAVREFSVLLSLDPVDRASAHFQFARALLESGKAEEARRQVLFSLEIAPGFEEAQRLLLDIVKP